MRNHQQGHGQTVNPDGRPSLLMNELAVIERWTQAVMSGDFAKAKAVIDEYRNIVPSKGNAFGRHLEKLREMTDGWSRGRLSETLASTIGDARCSFCGLGEDAGRRLIAGPDIFICDKCVSLCANLFSGQN